MNATIISDLVTVGKTAGVSVCGIHITSPVAYVIGAAITVIPLIIFRWYTTDSGPMQRCWEMFLWGELIFSHFQYIEHEQHDKIVLSYYC